ncbi:MAG TPA: hypothetical protein EYH54_05740 [Nautiliaceae bacterium]|nr:hypothetical protein [Nautiliaceae bacterium]
MGVLDLAIVIIIFSLVYIVLSEKLEKKFALLLSLSFAFLLYFFLGKNWIKLITNLFFALIFFFLFYVLYAFYYSAKQYNKKEAEIGEDFYKNKFLRLALIFAFLWFFISSFNLLDLINYELLRALLIFLFVIVIGLAFYYFIIKE